MFSLKLGYKYEFLHFNFYFLGMVIYGNCKFSNFITAPINCKKKLKVSSCDNHNMAVTLRMLVYKFTITVFRHIYANLHRCFANGVSKILHVFTFSSCLLLL